MEEPDDFSAKVLQPRQTRESFAAFSIAAFFSCNDGRDSRKKTLGQSIKGVQPLIEDKVAPCDLDVGKMPRSDPLCAERATFLAFSLNP